MSMIFWRFRPNQSLRYSITIQQRVTFFEQPTAIRIVEKDFQYSEKWSLTEKSKIVYEKAKNGNDRHCEG